MFGEWTEYKKYLNDNGIKVVNLSFNFKKFLPKYGYFQSRFSYILILLFFNARSAGVIPLKEPED